MVGKLWQLVFTLVGERAHVVRDLPCYRSPLFLPQFLDDELKAVRHPIHTRLSKFTQSAHRPSWDAGYKKK